MTRHRLPMLLALMAGLALLRWFVPPAAPDAPVDIAAPITSRPSPGARAEAEAVVPAAPPSLPIGPAGDAFQVRKPLLPPPVAAIPEPKAFVLVGPPAPVAVVEAPPPPPPIQVIGSWDDGIAPGVFVASVSGTQLARPGSVLFAEYRVTEASSRQLVLVHIASGREWRLPVPRVAETRP